MNLLVADLGTLPYANALELQRAAARARIAGDLRQDLLLLVEHPPVVTLGRNSKPAHLGVSAEFLASQGIELFEVERGGDVTYHGPGQLVGYPIFDLRGLRQDLHWYLRQLEETLIRTLAAQGVPATRNPGYTGVWATARPSSPQPPSPNPNVAPWASGPVTALPAGSPRKIASIGVHAREWVTWHGFALNVSTDLRSFDLMVPCGIPNVRMTSMSEELGRIVRVGDVLPEIVGNIAEVFGFSHAEWTTRESLERFSIPAHAP